MDAEILRGLTRKRLQSVAMSHGVKANGRTEAIIERLIERFPSGVPQPQPSDTLAPSRDNLDTAHASTAHLNTRTRPSSPHTRNEARDSHVQGFEGHGGAYLPDVQLASPSNQRPEEAPSHPQKSTRSLGVFTLSSASQADHRSGVTLAIPTAFPAGTQLESASTSRPVAAQTWQTAHWPGGYSFPPVQPMTQQIPYAMAAANAARNGTSFANSGAMLSHQEQPAVFHVPEDIRPSSLRNTMSRSSPRLSPKPTSTTTPSSHVAANHSQQRNSPSSVPSSAPLVPAPVAMDNAIERTSEEPPEQAEDNAWDQWAATEGQKPATDKMLYDAVCKMANIARFRDETEDNLNAMERENVRMKGSLSQLDAMIRQERSHLQRMRTFMDHVHPSLVPRWREEVIWDKACPTYLDDDGDLVEYDTDDEAAPRSPRPMVKWYRRPKDGTQDNAPGAQEQAGNHDTEPAKDTIPLPQTPKRRRADENDPPHRATKRSRRSAGATPAPTRTTRSAAKKAATDQRELDGIAEEEEEQVLSLLTHMDGISDRE